MINISGLIIMFLKRVMVIVVIVMMIMMVTMIVVIIWVMIVMIITVMIWEIIAGLGLAICVSDCRLLRVLVMVLAHVIVGIDIGVGVWTRKELRIDVVWPLRKQWTTSSTTISISWGITQFFFFLLFLSFLPNITYLLLKFTKWFSQNEYYNEMTSSDTNYHVKKQIEDQ